MRQMIFLGGVFVGGAFGLMAGADYARGPGNGGEPRKFPIVISMTLAIAGMGLARNAWHRAVPTPPQRTGVE